MRIISSREYNSIIMPVDAPSIADGVMADLTAQEYSLKEEGHITLLPREIGEQLNDTEFTYLAQRLLAFDDPDAIIRYGDLYEISKPKVSKDGTEYERQSLVSPVSIPKIASFMSSVVGEHGMGGYFDVADIPFHCTIAVKPDNPYAKRGIGIASRKEWVNLHPQRFNIKPWLADSR